jgi:intein/homing endonuclease
MLNLNYTKVNKGKINKCGGITTVMHQDSWEKLIGKPELARIIADINGDGHLQLQEWRGLVSFYSKNKEEIDTTLKKFKNLFGIQGRVYIDNRKNKRYKLFFISKSLAQFLNEIGVAKGNKTNCKFLVPGWVINGKKELKRAYLVGIFTTEGHIYSTKLKNGKIRWRIGLEQYKNEKIKTQGKKYMEQIRKMLEDFDIESSPVRFNGHNLRKDGSKSIGMRFDIEYKHFKNFYKEIGFDNKEKMGRLIDSMRGSKVRFARVFSKTSKPSG